MLFVLSLIHSVVFGVAGFLNLLVLLGSLGNAGKPGTHHSDKALQVYTGNVCELRVLLQTEYLSFMSNSD